MNNNFNNGNNLNNGNDTNFNPQFSNNQIGSQYSNNMNNQPNNMNSQFYQNQGQSNYENMQSPKKNNSKIIILIIIIAIVAVLAFALGSKLSNKTDNNNQTNTKTQTNNKTTNNDTKKDDESLELYKTVSAKDLADNNGTNYYKEYINKKITITDLEVSIDDTKTFIKAPGFRYFYANCENVSSLKLNNGETVSITGIVEDSPTTVDGNFKMRSCTINEKS